MKDLVLHVDLLVDEDIMTGSKYDEAEEYDKEHDNPGDSTIKLMVGIHYS
jgi:hypothetical protein